MKRHGGSFTHHGTHGNRIGEGKLWMARYGPVKPSSASTKRLRSRKGRSLSERTQCPSVPGPSRDTAGWRTLRAAR
jgi:hypothetical protein